MKYRRQKYSRMRKHKHQRSRKTAFRRRRLQSTRKRLQQQQQQQQQQQPHRFKQSGGDLLNYLPSDISMTMRSAAHSMGSAFSGIKGIMPSSNPLPFNDHHLQKETVSITDRLPNLQQYYKNANSMIPSL